MQGWTFLTNHAHVLLCLAQDPDVRLRDVAEKVGITERAAQRILADLEAEGYVVSRKVGRRNQYAINRYAPLRHPLEEQNPVGKLLRLIDGRAQPQSSRAQGKAPGVPRPSAASAKRR